MYRTLIAMLVLMLAMGCEDPAQVQPTAGVGSVAAPTPEPAPEPTETTQTLLPIETVTVEKGLGDDLYGYHGAADLNEMIAWSDVIVRGRFVSVKPIGFENLDGDGYYGALEFTFNVMEHLKGGRSGNTVKAVAFGYSSYEGRDAYHASTKAAAKDLARPLLQYRDTRWDDREAIVMLVKMTAASDSDLYFGHIAPDRWQITVADAGHKRWLPDASPPDSGLDPSRSASERLFLTDEPRQSSGSSIGGATTPGRSPSGPAPARPNVSLEAFKAEVARVQTKLDAGDGSLEYRNCVALTYRFNKEFGLTLKHHVLTGELASGMPAGTVAAKDHHFLESSVRKYDDSEPAPDGYYESREGLGWYVGEHAELMQHAYPMHIAITRPLPAGQYSAFEEWRDRDMVVCDGRPTAVEGMREIALTVVAPFGTLAEAFFDPVADGDAISATTTVGTISWEDGEVSATLTIEATGQLDFIGLTGTTTLSLSVAEAATPTPNTLSWPVATQPWSAGDQLMLRIRAVPPPAASVTVTLSPREEQVVTVTFTYADILIEWFDPDQCDSRYLVGLYRGESVVWFLGFHPAPETTSFSEDTQLAWNSIPNYDWRARVTRAPSGGSEEWRVLGEASLQSGLPSTP